MSAVGGAVLFFFCACDVVGLTVLEPMDAMHFFFGGLLDNEDSG